MTRTLTAALGIALTLSACAPAPGEIFSSRNAFSPVSVPDFRGGPVR
ncbi:3-methyl-2-oxobutanoate hydroxymethyltransferase [Oceanicola granulosus HTCC2516]|uniref:3-methyl-2-oxobutanoate hydroxymethyltransferase n=1 Tax=Oceanicola granulosus (strain ATCC BAA-861 / DSM 15982 / KCTC 12143 / HTCC2516) TaxID=314256 RepID=Q2CDZ4_OCEGH|nr:hypothetical protein [Oceanicola granulosus]EAR50944.1 3-methyl-2-oxobutanoate hydroxymethyltransferase [Oceanicola granulosus HTCC2516]